MSDENVNEAGAALAASNADKVNDWVKDGTKSAEPVTTETPAPPAGQPRDEAGKFLPKDAASVAAQPSATPTPSLAASASAAPPAPGASAQQIQEFIEAQHGEKNEPFKIPKGARIPLKRGETVEYKTIEQLQKEGMLELDYRHKTADTGRLKRELDQRDTDMRAAQARLEAREKFVQEQEAEFVAAQKDPAKMAAFQEHLHQYQNNPRYRQMVDDALAKRETDAELAVYREQEYAQTVQSGVETAANWITQIGAAPEFAGVSQDRVRALYAQALQSGQAQLDPAHVRAIYEHEARYLADSQSPLQKQLAALTAQVERLTASNGAEKHNAGTAHALARAKTPPVATTGAPAAPGKELSKGKFGPRDLAQRNSEWASQR